MYCQRLYYLEYVESIMPINEHVEDGLFQHRRVDAPSLQHRTRKEGPVLHTRSVQLSSERLGLTGKLDLVEEKDGAVYPVEYKRGPGRSGGVEGLPPYWENDAIQVCGQALLLEEELGVSIPRGILYYIGSKRASRCRSITACVRRRSRPLRPFVLSTRAIPRPSPCARSCVSAALDALSQPCASRRKPCTV
jgi:CRISPR-associated protein Cas1